MGSMWSTGVRSEPSPTSNSVALDRAILHSILDANRVNNPEPVVLAKNEPPRRVTSTSEAMHGRFIAPRRRGRRQKVRIRE
jgi:hypothetical protein